MVRIELMDITDGFVKYKYYPEDSKEFGIVVLNKKNRECVIEKQHPEYSINYATHALRRIEEFESINDFKKKDLVAWY